MDTINKLYALVDFCISMPFSAPVCRDFWITTTKAGLIFLSLALLAILIKVVRIQLEYHRNKKLVEYRKQIADAETMESVKWKGLDIFPDDLAEKDLANQFREALKAKE